MRSFAGAVWLLRMYVFVMVFSDEPVRGKSNQRGRPSWFDPRAEGCSQAFGVLRPTIVLSARFNHELEPLPSHKKAKNECLVWIILISSGSVGLDFLKWFKNFSTCLLVVA